MGESIDTLTEKQKIYRAIKGRIELIKKKESESGELMLTEMREHYTLAVAVLDKIRVESAKGKKSPSEVEDKMFKPWKKKIEAEKIASESK